MLLKSNSPMEIDRDLIVRFDTSGPRYTSYPTADRFVEAFDAAAYAAWLSKRSIGGISRPLSLYVHLPFCASICYYCACNKVITKDHSRSAKYLRYLEKEIALQVEYLSGERRIAVHTLARPVTSLLADLFRTADCDVVADMMAKVALDNALRTGLPSARRYLHKTLVDVIRAYKAATSVTAGGYGGGCRRPFDPPRYCPDCGRRLAVLITPSRVEGRCRDHGLVRPAS